MMDASVHCMLHEDGTGNTVHGGEGIVIGYLWENFNEAAFLEC